MIAVIAGFYLIPEGVRRVRLGTALFMIPAIGGGIGGGIGGMIGSLIDLALSQLEQRKVRYRPRSSPNDRD